MTQSKVIALLVVGFVCCWSITFGWSQQPTDQTSLKIESAVLRIIESIDVPATAEGPIKSIGITQGQMVGPDQRLASIVDDDARIELRRAKLELDIATRQSESEVELEFARKSRAVAIADYKRANESNRSYAGVVSDREMDRLRLLVDKSDAELDKIRFEKSILKMQVQSKAAAVDSRAAELRRHQILSPIGGQVVAINRRQGEWVNVADPIFKIVRLDRLRVETLIAADIASQSLVGAPAKFAAAQRSHDSMLASGQVVYVSPEIDPLNSKVQVWIEFENRSLDLRPGMKGKVQIELPPSGEQATEDKKQASKLSGPAK